jgi:CRISPR system Cascade subunit CasC
MSDFLQLHVLTAYPPSNPNRDDLGRPKTATIGGRVRQRISSQAIKRALRTAPAFETALVGHKGERTKRLGDDVLAHLMRRGVAETRAREIVREVAGVFGKMEGKDDGADKDKKKDKKSDQPASVRIAQLAFISPDERRVAFELAERAAAGEALPKEKDLAKLVLRRADGAVDIAMFGRMLADNPEFNRDAAVQVAHAFTTNAVEIEDDYYTALDDLAKRHEPAAYLDEAGFGSGVYYLYLCVDRELLVRNLDGDAALAERGIEALVRALGAASPSGKRNSFANHVRAEFILAEKGNAQPRSLASAFTRAVRGDDLMGKSIESLLKQRVDFAAAYGRDWDIELRLNVGDPSAATIDALAAFAASGLTQPMSGAQS